MYFRSFLAKETLITMADSSTKPIEELVEGDKIQTYNQNSKNYDGAHLENNEQVPGIITKLGKELVQRSDTVKVTLSNGSKIVITKDYPLVGGGKTAGWQIYDAFMYVKNYIGKTVTSNEELEEVILYGKEHIRPWVRISRIFRDIPMGNILGGADVPNMRELLAKKMKHKCRCIRCSEVKGRIVNPDDMVITMGAGNIWRYNEKYNEHLNSKNHF